MRTIDLSHPVTPDMQVYPGDPAVAFEASGTVAENGFTVTALHLGSHSGTHVDAPSHCVDGGATIDAVDLAMCSGHARVVDVSGLAALECIELGRVATELSDPDLPPIVIFRTLWSDHFGTPDYLRHPYLDPAIATRLVERGVRAVGMDLLSPDPTIDAIDLPFHDVFLGAGGLIYENLTDLAAVDSSD